MTPITTVASVLQRLKPAAIRGDEDGIAAMEFALIAPLIVGLYLGLAEMSLAVSVDQQIAHSASVAGDMVAQVTEVGSDDMADILSAALRVSQAPNASDFTMRVISYEMDDKGEIEDIGAAIYNPSQRGLLKEIDPGTLGKELLSKDSGVVVATVAYRYKPLGYKNTIETTTGTKGKAFLTSFVMRETFMLKPRRSLTVEIGAGKGEEMSCQGLGASLTCSGGDDPDDSTN